MDTIRQATELESLRNNEYFTKMALDMELSLLSEVKRISRDVNISSEKKGDMLIQVANKLCSLQDTIDSMDGIIQEGNNTQYEQEINLSSIK